MTDSDFREVSAETTSMENSYRLQRPKGLAKQKKYLPWVMWRSRLSGPGDKFQGVGEAMILARPRFYEK